MNRIDIQAREEPCFDLEVTHPEHFLRAPVKNVKASVDRVTA